MRTFGWGDGSLYLIGRALGRLSGGRARIVKYVLFAQPVATKPLVSESRRADILIRRVDARDRIAASFPRPHEVIAWRFANGGICFAATRADRFVGFIWLHEKPYEEDEVRCLYVPTPASESVWDYDVYLEPEHRLGRAFARMWEAVYGYLRSRGVRWTFSRISAFNPASLASHVRLGAERVGTATFFCLGRVQIALLPNRPYLHVSLGPGIRPRIELRVPIGAPGRP